MSFYEQAKAQQAAGEFAEASELYRRFLEEEPDDFRAFNNMGVCLEALGKAAAAEEAYREALALRPDLAAIHYNLGHLFQKTDAIDKAIGCYESALSIDPNYLEARYNLGIVFHEQDRSAEAEAAFKRLLQSTAPDDLPEPFKIYGNLGHALTDQGRFEEAVGYFREAVSILPANAKALTDLGICLLSLGQAKEAIEILEQALAINPQQRHARDALAAVHYEMGATEKSALLYEDLLKLAPADPIARHMLAAAGGTDTPARASDQYVEATFDSFADSFDRVLKRLNYRAPSLLADAVARFLQPLSKLDVLDAGCGTGLCGAWLRPFAQCLIGVDLSEKMLDKARDLEVYDELIKAELTEYLRAQSDCYDLIVSADTLVYFGDLDTVLANAAKALKPKGLLAFTVEALEGDEPGPGYRLNRHGRYSHSQRYVESLLKNSGLEVANLESTILRSENRRSVMGWLVTAIRPYSEAAG